MKRGMLAFLGSAVLCLGAAAHAQSAKPDPAAAARPAVKPAATPAVKTAAIKPVAAHEQDLNPVVKRYCAGCHSDRGKAGGLSLAALDVAQSAQDADVAEKMIRKLQAGFMPPPASPRPDPATYAALISTLESRVDAAAALKPNPGVRTFQRLN